MMYTKKHNTDLFQFTPLREGRHTYAGGLHLCYMFQFTPLREGRLCEVVR